MVLRACVTCALNNVDVILSRQIVPYLLNCSLSFVQLYSTYYGSSKRSVLSPGLTRKGRMFQSVAALFSGKGARDNDILYGTAVGLTLTIVVATTYVFRCLTSSLC